PSCRASGCRARGERPGCGRAQGDWPQPEWHRWFGVDRQQHRRAGNTG
nr:hypothetical protein [Tanacetum cinerariifolium]